jgi:putative MATE family efflux protein
MAEQQAAKSPARRGQQDFTQGPITRTMVVFTLPMLGTTILQSLNGSINAIWVGRFLGENALTATANGNILMFLIITFVFGLSMASTVLIGHAVGRRDIDQARRIMGTTIGSFMISLVALTALALIFAPQLLRLMATPEAAYDMALDYLRVILVSIIPAMLMMAITSALRGAGDAMTPFWFMIISVVLDTALNPVFILGLGPAPELGITGAGAATAIANTVSTIALLVYIYSRDLPLRLRGAELRYLKPEGALLGTIVKMGIPMGLQMIVLSSSAIVMQGIVNRHGVLVTAAYAATQQLWTYVQMPAMALGATSSSMVAQNIGAGKWDRVSRITNVAVVMNVLLTGAFVLLITLVDRAALSLFLGSHSPALEIGSHIHLLATWGFVFFGVTLVMFGTVRANGEVFWPLVIMFISMYPARIGVALIGEPLIGADAIWLSFPIGSIVAALLGVGLYMHGGWRKRRIGQAPPSPEEVIEEALATGEPGGSLNPRG